MKAWTLLALRLSCGLLMVWWGLDKLVNVEHGVAVAERFYLGIGTAPAFLQFFGVFQTLLGVAVMLGWRRRLLYPPLAAIAGVTAAGVWRSILDPWGWWLGRTNALFYPSLIILAAVLVLMAFRAEDRLALDARRGGTAGALRSSPGATALDGKEPS